MDSCVGLAPQGCGVTVELVLGSLVAFSRRVQRGALSGMRVVTVVLLSVCSTTLWVGQLDKRTTQQDVASLLEEFGPIESINVSVYSVT